MYGKLYNLLVSLFSAISGDRVVNINCDVLNFIILPGLAFITDSVNLIKVLIKNKVYNKYMSKYLFVFLCLAFLTSCVVYTEKRSQALSRAVAATVDSIEAARFDLASKYSKEAEKIAYPPKERVVVKPIITKDTEKVEIKNLKTELSNNKGEKVKFDSSVIKSISKSGEQKMVLRLVVPENLKHAKLLIENSEEWNELLKTKEFSDQLKQDNENLKKLAQEIQDELNKQLQMNNKLIEDLNKLQKEVLQKRLHIVKLYIVIVFLIGAIGGGIYLRIKGIL